MDKYQAIIYEPEEEEIAEGRLVVRRGSNKNQIKLHHLERDGN